MIVAAPGRRAGSPIGRRGFVTAPARATRWRWRCACAGSATKPELAAELAEPGASSRPTAPARAAGRLLARTACGADLTVSSSGSHAPTPARRGRRDAADPVARNAVFALASQFATAGFTASHALPGSRARPDGLRRLRPRARLREPRRCCRPTSGSPVGGALHRRAPRRPEARSPPCWSPRCDQAGADSDVRDRPGRARRPDRRLYDAPSLVGRCAGSRSRCSARA